MGVLELLTVMAILVACYVDSEQIANRCCHPSQEYNERLDGCSSVKDELKNAYSTITQGEDKNSDLTLPSGLVKQLDGNSKTEVTFKTKYELPRDPCSNGTFVTTFCTASNQTQCPGDMAPLVMTTRAQLKIDEDYYSPKEFCIIRGDQRTLKLRVCTPVCSQAVPCVRKCCDMDHVWDFNNGKRGKRCVLAKAQSWRPHFYSTESRKVPSVENDEIHPHYFIAHPKTFYIKNKTTFSTMEQRDSTSGKLSWIFRIGLNKNYYKRETRYSWIDSKEFWETSCVDGVINSAFRDSPEFKGMEEEDVLIETFPIGTGELPTSSTMPKLIIYGFGMTFSAVFILITLVVHGMLWHRQHLHGWTLMSYCASLLLTYVSLIFKYIHSIIATRREKADGLCIFIGVMVNYFFICTFCWLTVQNLDLWLTFRKLQVRTKSLPQVRRYLAYAAFGLGLPLTFIVVGLTLDAIYKNEPETTWIIPEYGLYQCGPYSDLANWVYQSGPAGILYLFNLILFATTSFSIYKMQREARFARSSSSRNQDAASRAKLFCKLLIAMGVPYMFEFISSLAEGFVGSHVPWYWVILDVLHVLQGVFIFAIFVCKKETWNALKEKYDFLLRLEIGNSIATGSTALESSAQAQVNTKADA